MESNQTKKINWRNILVTSIFAGIIIFYSQFSEYKYTKFYDELLADFNYNVENIVAGMDAELSEYNIDNILSEEAFGNKNQVEANIVKLQKIDMIYEKYNERVVKQLEDAIQKIKNQYFKKMKDKEKTDFLATAEKAKIFLVDIFKTAKGVNLKYLELFNFLKSIKSFYTFQNDKLLFSKEGDQRRYLLYMSEIFKLSEEAKNKLDELNKIYTKE